MKIQCPAKINLFLEVTGRRPDGYHSLATLFAKINLYDVLVFSPAPGGKVILTVREPDGGGGMVPVGPGNLVFRAAEAFRRMFRVKRGVHILLEKNIPVGAGLGGGSSDAAGALAGLARFFDIKATASRKKRMMEIAASLGADVPFFLHPAPFCLGRGIGDKLKPVAPAASLPYMILIYPGVAVPTAEAYKSLTLPARSDVLTRLSHLDKLTRSLSQGKPISYWESLLFNRLEEARIPVLSYSQQARDILKRLGARGVLMSGSGSSVFGFVSSHEEGRKCLARLQGYPWTVFLTSCQG